MEGIVDMEGVVWIIQWEAEGRVQYKAVGIWWETVRDHNGWYKKEVIRIGYLHSYELVSADSDDLWRRTDQSLCTNAFAVYECRSGWRL